MAGFRPAGRPASARPARSLRTPPSLRAVADKRGLLVRPRPSFQRDADRTTPPVSCVSYAHGGAAAAPAAASEVLGPRVRAHQLRLTSADPSLPRTRALLPSSYRNRVTGGRPPWPTIGRPPGPGRVQADGLASFHRGWGGWCSRCKARGSS